MGAMFKLKCLPSMPMTQEEMERQCKLVSNAAVAMERLYGECDPRKVIVDLKTLECRLEGESWNE